MSADVIGSVVSGIIQNMGQSYINSQNIAEQRKINNQNERMFYENLKAQEESQARQNEYNSIGAQIQRAQDAGVAASALFQNGSPTSQSGSQSVGSSLPTLVAPRAEMIDTAAQNSIANLSMIAKSMSDVASSELSTAQKEKIYKNLYEDWRAIKLSNDEKAIKVNLDMQFADKERQMRYDLLIAEKSKKAVEIALDEAMTEESKMKAFNLVSDSLYKDALRLLAKKDLATFDKRFALWQNETEQKIRESKANQKLTEAKTATEGENKEHVSLLNDLQEIQNAIQKNEKKISDKTVYARINEVSQRARNLRTINDIQKKELEKLQVDLELARKQNNTYMENLIWSRIKDIVGMAVSINGAANQSVKTGVSTGLMLGGF